MGKSLKNGVSPDEIFEEYGCDTLRLYEMSMGPLNASQPWNPRDIVGLYRFLQRLWRNLIDESTGAVRVADTLPDARLSRATAQTIGGVRRDIERLALNTAIAKLIELNNLLTKIDTVPRRVACDLVLLLAPFAPHFSEELWHRLGHPDSLAFHPYPTATSEDLQESVIEIPIAVSGKVRARVAMRAGASKAEAESIARRNQTIQRYLAGKSLQDVVFIPGRMLNFVLK
jgi:leucyl-tRNA synthetase